MGHAPPPMVPVPASQGRLEELLRRDLRYRHSRFKRRRRRAHAACLELTRRAEIQLGWLPDPLMWSPPPPPKPATPTYRYCIDDVAAIYTEPIFERANRIADAVLEETTDERRLQAAADEERARYDREFRWGY